METFLQTLFENLLCVVKCKYIEVHNI